MRRLIYTKPRPFKNPTKLTYLSHGYSFLRKCILSAKFVQKALTSETLEVDDKSALCEVAALTVEELELEIHHRAKHYHHMYGLVELFHAYHALYRVLLDVMWDFGRDNPRTSNTRTLVSRLSAVIAYTIKIPGRGFPAATLHFIKRRRTLKKPTRWFDIMPRKAGQRAFFYERRPKVSNMYLGLPAYKSRKLGHPYPPAKKLMNPTVHGKSIEFCNGTNTSLFSKNKQKGFKLAQVRRVPAVRAAPTIYQKLAGTGNLPTPEELVVFTTAEDLISDKARIALEPLAASYADRQAPSRFKLAYSAGIWVKRRTNQQRFTTSLSTYKGMFAWPAKSMTAPKFIPRAYRYARTRASQSRVALFSQPSNLVNGLQPRLLGRRTRIVGLRWCLVNGGFSLKKNRRARRVRRRLRRSALIARLLSRRAIYKSQCSYALLASTKSLYRWLALGFKQGYPRGKLKKRGRLRGRVLRLLGKAALLKVHAKAPRILKKAHRGFKKVHRGRKMLKKRRRKVTWWLRRALWKRRRKSRRGTRALRRAARIRLRQFLRPRAQSRRWTKIRLRNASWSLRLRTIPLLIHRCLGMTPHTIKSWARKQGPNTKCTWGAKVNSSPGLNKIPQPTHVRQFATFIGRSRSPKPRVRWLRKYNPNRYLFKHISIIRSAPVLDGGVKLAKRFIRGILFRRLMGRRRSIATNHKLTRTGSHMIHKRACRTTFSIRDRGLAQTHPLTWGPVRLQGAGATLTREMLPPKAGFQISHLRTARKWSGLIRALSSSTCWERRRRVTKWLRKRSAIAGRWRVRRLHLAGSGRWRHRRFNKFASRLSTTLLYRRRFVKATTWRGIRRRFAGFWCHKMPPAPRIYATPAGRIEIERPRRRWFGHFWNGRGRVTKKIRNKLREYRRKQGVLSRVFLENLRWLGATAGRSALAAHAVARIKAWWAYAKNKYVYMHRGFENRLRKGDRPALRKYKQSVRRTILRRRASRGAHISRSHRLRFNTKRHVYWPFWTNRGHSVKFIGWRRLSMLSRVNRFFQPRFARQRLSRTRFSVRRHARDWFLPNIGDRAPLRRFVAAGRRRMGLLKRTQRRLKLFRRNANVGFFRKPNFGVNPTGYTSPAPGRYAGSHRVPSRGVRGHRRALVQSPAYRYSSRMSNKARLSHPTHATRGMWIRFSRVGPSFRFRKRKVGFRFAFSDRRSRRPFRRKVKKASPKFIRLIRPRRWRRRKVSANKTLHRVRAPLKFRLRGFSDDHRWFYMMRHLQRDYNHLFARPILKPRRRGRRRQVLKRFSVPSWFWWFKRRKWHRYWKLALKKKRQKSRKLSGRARYVLVGRWKSWRHLRARRLRFALIRNPATGFWWRAAKRWPRRRRAMSAAIRRMWRALQNRHTTRRVRRAFFLSWYFDAFTGEKKHKGTVDQLNDNFQHWLQGARRLGFFKRIFNSKIKSKAVARPVYVEDRPWGRVWRFKFKRTLL